MSRVARTTPWQALCVVTAVQGGRLAVILGASALLPALGVRGWDVGLVVNILCCIYAVVLVTAFRLWRTSGIARIRVGPMALVALVPLALEACSWLIPTGVAVVPPGYGWWFASLLLVGINEELVSRVVVLSWLRRAFPVVPAVLISAALFGLQHLSHLATRDASPGAVTWTVVTTACFGLAYGAFQARFGWALPLILLHTLSDWFSILTPGHPGDLIIGTGLVLLVGTAWMLLATRGPGAGARNQPDHDGQLTINP